MSAGTRGGREEKEPQGDPQKQLRPAAPRVWCTLCACGCPPLPDARRWEKGSTRIRIRFESPDTPRPTPAPEYLAPHATPGTRARMTFVASPRIRSVGCIYADRCVYAPDAAYTHMCLYAVVGAYTRALGAYTQVGVRLRERWVCIRSGCVYTPPGAYTRVGAYTRAVGACTQRVRIHTRVRIRGQVRLRER